MKAKKEGAAIRQDHRANRQPACRRQPTRSVARWQEPEEWSRGKCVVVGILGAVYLYAFMWLACAY